MDPTRPRSALQHHPFSVATLAAFRDAISRTTKPVVRQQMLETVFAIAKSRLEAGGDPQRPADAFGDHVSTFLTPDGLTVLIDIVLLGVADVWSAIRKVRCRKAADGARGTLTTSCGGSQTSSARLASFAPYLPISHIQRLFDELVACCEGEQTSCVPTPASRCPIRCSRGSL